ncbi:unnamed protein product [Pleuronectes platessa]|uniref:Uncharacterized protein n=1 Tax=Pleuronectes platessa TaxID=8262 RepID=A0A9N7V3C3_PLEPL|nr:unnamed protein product [Pleuronectes platessa]
MSSQAAAEEREEVERGYHLLTHAGRGGVSSSGHDDGDRDAAAGAAQNIGKQLETYQSAAPTAARDSDEMDCGERVRQKSKCEEASTNYQARPLIFTSTIICSHRWGLGQHPAPQPYLIGYSSLGGAYRQAELKSGIRSGLHRRRPPPPPPPPAQPSKHQDSS